MKKFIQSLFFFSFVFTALADTIEFNTSFDLKDYKGQTYLGFMESTVKPALDVIASEGYEVRGAEDTEKAYWLSDPKVRKNIDQNWGGLEHVKEIAEAIATSDNNVVTLDTLPGRIGEVDASANRYKYKLATFLGLASGGGVSIKYAPENYSLNVHYDETEQKSGRSFGVSNERLANDASDKDYLDDLEDYVVNNHENLNKFYKTLFEALLNSDTSKYGTVSASGQAVLTDFLAVMTAEQARNLMDGRVAPHWDAALLEVTLLASFHAGQDTIQLYYKDAETGETIFTDTTKVQTPCQVPVRNKRAQLRDYWQFSKNITNAENCGRSGINVTKSEFKKLEKKITQYVVANNPDLVTNLRASLGRESGRVDNVFQALSEYLISGDAPRSLEVAKVNEITQAWVKFLEYARNEAQNITAELAAE